MNKYPKVAIIFPTFNGWQDTKECLKSVEKLDYPQDKIEIIVVDNGSTDQTLTGIRKNFPKVKVLAQKTNLGFAKAINLGVKEAKSELILITNNDVVFEKNCLKKLVKTAAADSHATVIGGKVYWKNTHRLSFGGFRLNHYLGYHQFDLSGANKERQTDWISGVCLLTSKKLFLDLGGFDEKYFFYFEDIDFCLRAKRAGLRLLYQPKALVYHGYGTTIYRQGVEKILYLGYRSRWRCIFKNASPVQILTSSLFLFFFSPLYQSLLTRHNVYRPMLKGLWSTLKDD